MHVGRPLKVKINFDGVRIFPDQLADVSAATHPPGVQRQMPGVARHVMTLVIFLDGACWEASRNMLVTAESYLLRRHLIPGGLANCLFPV